MTEGFEIETVPTHKLAELELAKRALRVLTDHYPGYHWRVGLNDEKSGGILYIMNQEVNEQILGAPNWGHVLKISTVYADPDLKCVMRAGGEILESANINRGWNKEEVIKHIDGLDVTKHPMAGFVP